MKSTSMARGFELAKLLTQVGLKEFQSGDFKSRVQQAVLITRSLSNLKGAAMKAGQLLSLEMDNYFPPEAIEILSQLQNSAVAHPFSEIKTILEKELDHKQRSLIESIDPDPIGVASIGQVHKARYKNRDIVIKVQYADVAGSVDSDLKLLKTLATSFCQITGRKMDLDPLFEEMKSIFEQELDYEAEAQFQNLFREKVAQLNQSDSLRFRVPEIIPELSSAFILAMSFEKGLTLRQWLNTKPKQKEKQLLATSILDLYFHEYFQWGLVQTDPNWGNFLINKESSILNLCLLDFGATRRYDRKFIQNYITLLDYAAKNQSKELKALAIEMGWIDSQESESAFAAFELMMTTAIKPFFTSRSGASSFDFTDLNHSLESQVTAKALVRELKFSPPPYAIIFLHRKLAGVYSILKSLEVKMDLSPYWNMMSELSKKENV